MENIIEVEKDQVCAKVQISAKEVDASFSHAFGTRKETEIEITGSELVSYELWDEDFNKVVSNKPTEAEKKWLIEKAEEEFYASV